VVPYYYFRRSATGALSNGSFCNNDIDSNRLMVRKFILDSCKCWMEAYDIDGFRFDLMGVLDVVTMNEVVAQSRSIKPDAMIYGEGWNMPTLLDESLKANMGNQVRMPAIGHFNDFFRENVKGKTSPNEITARGYCSGDTNFLPAMFSAMIGNCLNDDKVKLFQEPHQSINYVECHDNSTSWDKLKECCREDQREVRIRKQKLMIATILVSQGIPFLHSGQEFCRTKSGNHNSYRSNDPLNQLDWLRRERYDEVVRYTRDLIQVRKDIPAFRMSSSEDIEKHVMFSSLDNKVLIYHLHHLTDQKYSSLFVYVNPTSQVYYQNFPDYVDLLANEAGMIKDYAVQNVAINPYTMVIVGTKSPL
jgi:pullulanase